jgi:hypothetical protein
MQFFHDDSSYPQCFDPAYLLIELICVSLITLSLVLKEEQKRKNVMPEVVAKMMSILESTACFSWKHAIYRGLCHFL